MTAEVLDLTDRQGQRFFDQGLTLLHNGLLAQSIEKFRLAIRWKPTPEAYTHLAWALSFEHKYQEAIELCLKAIEIDADWGVPYNDIGMYFMKLGDLEAAEPWLEKAKNAKRYEKRQAPYLNLGRIYLARCQFIEALVEFEEALKLEPENVELRTVVERIRQKDRAR